jgi:hypothetical protein
MDTPDLDEPTAEEIGQVRPGTFRPENVLAAEAMRLGRNYIIRVCKDPDLAGLIGRRERDTIPFVAYQKLELPRRPGWEEEEEEEVIPLSALLHYSDYNVSDAYLDGIRQELTRTDYVGESKTHTDVLVRVDDFKDPAGVAIATFSDPANNGEPVTVVAVALALPSDYPIPVNLRVLPQVAGRLIHHLLAYHRLGEMPAETQLRRHSVLRLAFEPLRAGNAREMLYCAAICAPDHPAAQMGMPNFDSSAFRDYMAIMQKEAEVNLPGLPGL